jgi:hypothetical protein
MKQKFTSVSAQLLHNLAEALIISGTNHSVLPQYFKGSLALALSPDTPWMLKGFIQLQQIRKHLNQDVQGSYLQQQNEAIRKFEDSATSMKFSVYDAQKLLVYSYGPTLATTPTEAMAEGAPKRVFQNPREATETFLQVSRACQTRCHNVFQTFPRQE